jgi:hypothetical protein
MIRTRRKKAEDTITLASQRPDVFDPAYAPTANSGTAKLAVIACNFNFANYKRPQHNLLRFLRQMDAAGVPVYGIELVKVGQSALMEGNPNWKIVQGTDRSLLWQKEVLMNNAARLVPSHIKYIAAVDTDVAFMNPRWVEDTVEALKEHKVVQPFARCVWTDEIGLPNLTRESCAKAGLSEKWNGHPGFAWAARRDFFLDVGFYPYALLGAGDTVTAVGTLGIEMLPSSRAAVGMPNMTNGVLGEWMARARHYMGDTKLGYVDGDLWHEWHGDRKNRAYHTRAEIIKDMDILNDVRMNSLGFLEWTKQADNGMILKVAEYFKGRKEDGNSNA